MARLPRLIKNRAVLADAMEDQMALHYGEVKGRRKAPSRQNQVKTQIIESHLTGDSWREKVISKLRQLSHDTESALPYSSFDETEDENLFALTAPVEDDTPVRIYVDTTDKRFWILHSLDKSEQVRPRMENLASLLGAGFDNVWFTGDMLDATAGFGSRRGVKISFIDFLSYPEVPENDLDTLKMTMKSWRVDRYLNFLRRETGSPFASRVSVSASIVKAVDTDDETRFALEDVYRNGFFSARGTSAVRHLEVVQVMKDRYSMLLMQLENEKAIEWSQSQPNGEVLVIALEREDINVESLVSLLSSGRPPFSLWGLPARLRHNHYRVDLVDLHLGNVNKVIAIEVSPSWIRVKLPHGACGNVVTRLLSNVQRGVDSGASLLSAAGEVIA